MQKDGVEVLSHPQKGGFIQKDYLEFGGSLPLLLCGALWGWPGMERPPQSSQGGLPGPLGSDAQGLWKREAKADSANIKGFRGPFVRLLMRENRQNQSRLRVWAGSQQVQLPLASALN